MAKDRSEKKEKKEKRKSVDASGVKKEKKEKRKSDATASSASIPLGALVPFANPLCDEKATKKVLKTVKKAWCKEVVKAVRKTTPADPATAQVAAPAIVILAADISPMDVISHIPVLCEDHNIPYVFLPSRAELGAAGSTKRPTSVVMVTPTAGKKGEEKDDEWDEAYKELNKLVVKQGQHVKV
ncbi:unnamed protein product [Aureobasidium pullulans]|nr:unnamed protein product [Aureobasidium pullulans]